MVVSLGLGGMALLVGFAALAARRSFLGRIESLQRALDKAPKALAVRTDLPPEVVALARRLGVSDSGGGRLVRLTQSGEMWLKPGSKPLAFKAEQTIAVAEVGGPPARRAAHDADDRYRHHLPRRSYAIESMVRLAGHQCTHAGGCDRR